MALIAPNLLIVTLSIAANLLIATTVGRDAWTRVRRAGHPNAASL